MQSALFLPCYNAAGKIGLLMERIMANSHLTFNEIWIIDNASTDGTIAEVRSRLHLDKRFRLLKNFQNYGYGGSHKVALNESVKRHLDYLFVIPGDGQGDLDALTLMLQNTKNHDLIMGSRFLEGGAVYHGYPAIRGFGNKCIRLMHSWCTGTHLTDAGTGQVGYRIEFMKKMPFNQFADDFHFTPQVLLWACARGAQYKEVPVNWNASEKSSVPLSHHALKMAKMYFYFKTRGKIALGTSQERPFEILEAVLG